MRQHVFKYLSQYSTTPKDVDRLIISAFLEINKLELKKNKLLKSYFISSKSTNFLSHIQFKGLKKKNANYLMNWHQ